MHFDLIAYPEKIADAIYMAVHLGYHHTDDRRPTGRELAERICSTWRKGNERHLAAAFTAGEFQRKIGD